MTRIALVFLLIAASGGCAGRLHEQRAPSTRDRGKVNVYVFTAPPASRVPTIDEQARANATADLIRRLRDRKNLVVVDTPQQADVVVQLLSPVQLFDRHAETLFDDRELIADVTAGGKKVRLSAARVDRGRTIYRLARDIDEWVVTNARPK